MIYFANIKIVHFVKFEMYSDNCLYHVQVVDASVEVVCAVILTQGYGWWSQEVESVIDSEKKQIKANVLCIPVHLTLHTLLL